MRTPRWGKVALILVIVMEACVEASSTSAEATSTSTFEGKRFESFSCYRK